MDIIDLVLLWLIFFLFLWLFIIQPLSRSTGFQRHNKEMEDLADACESKEINFWAAQAALRRLRGEKGAIPIESERVAWICIEAINRAVQSGSNLRQIGTSSEEMMDFRSGYIPGFPDRPEPE